MKKKKILSMLLATVMVAGSLAGCGSSGDTQSTSTDTSTGSKTEKQQVQKLHPRRRQSKRILTTSMDWIQHSILMIL